MCNLADLRQASGRSLSQNGTRMKQSYPTKPSLHPSARSTRSQRQPHTTVYTIHGTMEDALENTAAETIHDLTIRLRRLEFLLVGNKASTTPTPTPITQEDAAALTKDGAVLSRLNKLDKQLSILYNRNPTVRNMLDIYIQFPEVFNHPSLPTPLPQHLFPHSPEFAHPSSTLSQPEKLATVLATASTFHTFSSQLNSIMDSPIPNPSTSAEILSLLPRIHKVDALQQAQMREIVELKRKTAEVLERWYLVGVEGVNECAAEWDGRTEEVERGIGRIEKARAET